MIYPNTTILLGGKPLVTADVTMRDTPFEPPTVEPDVGRSFSGVGTFDLPGADALAKLFDVWRLSPTPPAGYVSIPWGILGSIRLNGVVDGAMSGGDRPCPRMEFAMPENEVRRAVSVAVQQAIMNPHRLDYVAHEATRHESPTVCAMGRRLVAPLFPGGCYRGERKRRRAMRRLLRAAGVLGKRPAKPEPPRVALRPPEAFGLTAEEMAAQVDLADELLAEIVAEERGKGRR